MKKSINLNSQEWCDIIFKDKNKAYGAYKLRQSSSKRHLVAFFTAMLFMALVVTVPYALKAFGGKNPDEGTLTTYTGGYIMEKIEDQVPEENIIKEETAPPPPPMRQTIQFIPPVIAPDELVSPDTEVATVDEILSTRDQISIATVLSGNEEGVDIADLPNHEVIVEAEPEVFQIVEQMPSFPGGDTEMLRYIGENIKYPVVAQETGIQGQVVIRFVVTATGAIDDAQVIRSLDPSCDREAMRVVKSMPKWTPGRQNGKNVAVYFTLPVRFRLK